ncbi:MAG: ABC transporter substrate-binding protein [Pseudomonadota bacterium]
MRFAEFTIGLAGLALATLGAVLPVHAQTIEERRLFNADAPVVIKVLSTADLDVFEPYIAAFQDRHSGIGVDYTVSSSTEAYGAIRDGAQYDVVISSAMDLQFQLANDGFAQAYASDTTGALPSWAKWRDLIFAFTSEPAVAVVSTQVFEGLDVPRTRQDLIAVLRENADRFSGAVGTYDLRSSGLGYLFATQEARISDAYWRLTEVMGRLDPVLYCCSAQMIDDVADGKLAVAYNVLGSYATQRLGDPGTQGLEIIVLEDFDNVMLRTAILPKTAEHPREAGQFIDALLDTGLRETVGDWGLPPLASANAPGELSFGPIRLGPTLLVYLDPLNRRTFLESWESAIDQGR